jgi:DNA-binding transcriptional ArsR family regulator
MAALDREETPCYRVEVDWAPAHELMVSLGAYLSRREHKTLDLGPEWVRNVRRRLTPELAADLAAERENRSLGLIELLVQFVPGERTVDAFLHWLAEVSAGELYELAMPYLPDDLIAELRGFDRERAVRILSAWNEQYFRHIDPAILRGLEVEASARRALIGTMPAIDLVEQATFGLVFVPDPVVDVVVLIPQYHYRPWNLYFQCNRLWRFTYPADVLPPAPGEPPSTVLRAARVLSDASRLRILRFLARGPASFTEVARFSGLSKSTVHHHMVALRAAGLVRVRQTSIAKHFSYSLRMSAIDEFGESLRAYLREEETT